MFLFKSCIIKQYYCVYNKTVFLETVNNKTSENYL